MIYQSTFHGKSVQQDVYVINYFFLQLPIGLEITVMVI